MISVERISPGRRKLILAILLALLGWPVFSQSGVGVSPPRVELSALPGTQVTQTVTIDSPGTASNLSVQVNASDALLTPEGDVIWIAPGSHAYSLAPWLEVNPLQFELDPGQRRDVTY